MTTDLDQALLSGNVEDIEALLDGMDLSDDQGLLSGDEVDNEDGANTETGVDAGAGEDDLKVIDTTSQSNGAADQAANANAEPSKEQGTTADNVEDLVEINGKYYLPVQPDKAAVASKDGNHTIPFAVLEKARKSASEANSKIEQLESQLNESATSGEKLAMYAKQLEAAGITPDKLPTELLNDESALQALQDELPETAANLLTALVKKAQGTTATPDQPPSNEGAHDVDSALEAEELADLKGWEQGDQDRWDMALVIDNQLKNSPQFQALPLQERFAEVQRRVKAAFGDPVQASIDAENAAKNKGTQDPSQAQDPTKAEQANIIPNSPSSLGGSATDTTQEAHEALLNQDALALEKSLEGMSPEKVEEFLAQAVMALD